MVKIAMSMNEDELNNTPFDVLALYRAPEWSESCRCFKLVLKKSVIDKLADDAHLANLMRK